MDTGTHMIPLIVSMCDGAHKGLLVGDTVSWTQPGKARMTCTVCPDAASASLQPQHQDYLCMCAHVCVRIKPPQSAMA